MLETAAKVNCKFVVRIMPNPDKPELKIEDLLMSLRSVLFKSEDILGQFFFA